MAVIDFHNHIAPESCMPMEAVAPNGKTYGLSVHDAQDGVLSPVINGKINHNCDADQLYSVERRLREMDDARVDFQVLSPVTFFFFYNLPAEENADRARRINRAMADIVHDRPDRFHGMATVPLQDPEMAAAELDHAVHELGLIGVEVGSNVNGKNFDDPSFRPFFEMAEKCDVPIFVHPVHVAAADRLGNYYFQNLIGNPLDTAICAASLIFGGVLDDFPKLKLVFAHGGGIAPFLVGRWNHGKAVRAENQALPRPPEDYLKMLYYDTITHDRRALSYVCDLVGPSQVMLGTDYPFDMGDTAPVDTVDQLTEFDEDVLAGIRGGNAARLYNIEI